MNKKYFLFIGLIFFWNDASASDSLFLSTADSMRLVHFEISLDSIIEKSRLSFTDLVESNEEVFKKTTEHYGTWIAETDISIAILAAFLTLVGFIVPLYNLLIFNKLKKDIEDRVSSYASELKELKDEYFLLKEEIEMSAQRLKNTGVLYQDVNQDLINFSSLSLHLSNVINKDIKAKYEVKFEKHRLFLGLYNTELTKIYTHLQMLCYHKPLSDDLIPHLENLEKYISYIFVSSKEENLKQKSLHLIGYIKSKIIYKDIIDNN